MYGELPRAEELEAGNYAFRVKLEKREEELAAERERK